LNLLSLVKSDNPALQQHQLWIGLGFALFLIIFLMIAFFKAKDMTVHQHNIIKFLSALCAAFSGGLIAGDALFKMGGTIGGNTKFAITGAAGFALFFVVWFFYPRVAQLTEGFNFSVPADWTFQQAVDAFAQSDHAVVAYDGFKKKELDTPLKERELHEKSVGDAIRRLRFLTTNPNMIREYEVRYEDSTYYLRIKA
jgi:hypothetical protein